VSSAAAFFSVPRRKGTHLVSLVCAVVLDQLSLIVLSILPWPSVKLGARKAMKRVAPCLIQRTHLVLLLIGDQNQFYIAWEI
jgi:hypothetical protein